MDYEAIDSLLKDKGLSRRKLAEMAGVSANTLSSAFRRRSEGLPYETVRRIADALGVECEELMGRDSNGKEGFGDKLRNARKARGMTQQELAEASGLSIGAIGNYEAGNRNNVSYETVLRLAKALGVAPQTIRESGETESGWLDEILTAFDRLNDKGQTVAIMRVEELAQIPRYTQPDINAQMNEALREMWQEDKAAKAAVNHPAHYNAGKFEVIDVIEDWRLGFNLGNAVKYIARADHKGDAVTDLEKAEWYIHREIERRKAGGAE